jgi:uncharacterized protein YggE
MNARKLVVLTAIAAAAIGAEPALAQAQDPNLITVTGEAEVKVVPDEVVLRLGVQTGDRDLALAKKMNDERVARALGVARRHVTDAKLIQTDFISIEPRYRGSSEIVNDLIGYVVRKSIVVTLKDTSKFEELLSAMLDAGVNYVHGVDFRTTELRKHRDQARALAIRAAQEKAAALASAVGRKAGKARSISEGSFGLWSGYGSWWGGGYSRGMSQTVVQNAGGGGGVALGQITIRGSVSATFTLE